MEVLEGVYKEVMTPTKNIEPGITGSAELAQVILPLLLVVYSVSQDDVSYVIADSHAGTSSNCVGLVKTTLN